jgi:hypothetical protein
MINFKEFIREMAKPTGEPLNTTNKDRSQEWQNILTDIRQKRFLEYINIVKPQMKLFKYGNTFYLSDKEDNYIAHIDVIEEKIWNDLSIPNNKLNVLFITHGNSIRRGKYIILLKSILNLTSYDIIFSDNQLSDGAIKFYKKLIQNDYTLALYNNRYMERIDKNNINKYFKDTSYRIGLYIDKDFLKKLDEEYLLGVRQYNDEDYTINYYGFNEEM